MTITQDAEILSGDPRIEGTRIGVLQVYELAVMGEYSAADVADQLGISVGDVYSALAYYYDHPERMRHVRDRHQDATQRLAETALQPPRIAD